MFSSQLDFWLNPVSTERPVDIRVPGSSLSSVKEFLRVHNIPYSVTIKDVQVWNRLIRSLYSDQCSCFVLSLISLVLFACHIQELLNEEKAEMQMNQMKERITRSFNFAAYHELDAVSQLYKHETYDCWQAEFDFGPPIVRFQIDV